MHRRIVVLTLFTMVAFATVEVGDAWARARGGGSRGSRSWSAPARPSPAPGSPATPASPARSLSQPAPATAMPGARPSFFSRFGGMLGGFALGGLLGGLLFGGLGHGLGFGMLDLLLLGGIAFMAWQLLRRRREAAEPAYATAGASGYTEPRGAGGVATVDDVAGATAPLPIDRGLDHVRQMDPSFDPAVFADRARPLFASVQAAVAARDVGILRDRLTPEMANVLGGQCDELRRARRSSHLERVQIERAEVTEIWQEAGQDFVTVYFTGSMLDYTTDDRTGEVVDGSRTESQRFEEFWTFTRPVGPNPWKLGAIQSA